MNHLETYYLAREIKGELIGDNKILKGVFNLLSDAKEGDMVIRHWVDENGIKIAAKKKVGCFITQNPKGKVREMALKLGLNLIIVDKIELANAFALKWTIDKFAPNSKKVAITGTNGKSTTTHLIYHILKEGGYNVFTNTDSKSEFNTLIDPMVAKNISNFYQDHDGAKIEYLVIEVSEVQGWFDKVMKDHALLMTRAINPQVVVITNVALDHIGLVNSLDEAFEEISGGIKALNNGVAVLNHEDEMVVRMQRLLNFSVESFFYGEGSELEFKDSGIFYRGEILLEKSRLPFTSPHFIQNTLAAISACISLNIPLEIIKNGVYTYKPLKRRFSILNSSPTSIDDFAHNPDGIKATTKSALEITSGKLWVLCAIRGSRGKDINLINARALSETISLLKKNKKQEMEFEIYLTSSSDVVDHLNQVEYEEKEIFFQTLNDHDLTFKFFENLEESLNEILRAAHKNDTILLMGAQGMDPASEILDELL